MAFGFSSYVDPGVYQQEVIVPSGLNIPAQPFALCLVGTGSRNKRITNETVLRGVVKAEALTVAAVTPRTAELANRSDRRSGNTSLFRLLNGITTTMLPQYVSYLPAYCQSTVNQAGVVNLTTTNAIGIALDGIAPITMILTQGTGATTFIGRQVTVQSSFVSITTATQAELATAINKGLNDSAVLGYGATYTSAATVQTVGGNTFLRITSPLSTTNSSFGTNLVQSSSASDVQLLDPFVNTAVTTIFGVTAADSINRLAPSFLIISDLVFNASATWTLNYVNVNSTLDPLVQTTNIQALVGVGSSPGQLNFLTGSDYKLTGQTVDWSSLTAAAVTAIPGSNGTAPGRTYDLGLNNLLVLEMDGKVPSAFVGATSTQINCTLSGLASPPAGYVANPGSLASGAHAITIAAGATTSTLTDSNIASPGFDQGMVGQSITITGATNAVNNASFVVASVQSATQLTFNNGGVVTVSETTPGTATWSFGVGSAATAANIATNINAIMAAALGPGYKAVATTATVAGTTRVVLTSPSVGQVASSIQVDAAAALSAHTALFGAVIPFTTAGAMGSGKRPAVGTAYFSSYDFTRLVTDYNVPFRSFSVESALSQVGLASASVASYNPLALASQIAFENGAQFIYTVQINDTNADGNPTRQQVTDAMNGAAAVSGTTELVILDQVGTRLDISTDFINILSTQNGPTEKHYMRGFFGMAVNTPIGDRDTPASLIGRATRTLQVGPADPARGRMFMMAPPQLAGVTKTFTLDDSTSARITLDGTYLGAAFAAARTSSKLFGPADTMTKKTLIGFNTDDITTPWKPAERRLMAGQGVCVVTFDAGRFVLQDAISTEAGGGGLTSFTIDSTSYQKDVVVKAVNQALDANIVGIVPYDLATFVLNMKLLIQGVLANRVSTGVIGPYRDKASGAVRPVDARIDIRVNQDPNIPTQFNFAYWFLLRYPALRLLGQYSVDNPFFALAS